MKRHTCEILHHDNKDKIREYKLLCINGLYPYFRVLHRHNGDDTPQFYTRKLEPK